MLGSSCTDCLHRIISPLKPVRASHCLFCTISTLYTIPASNCLHCIIEQFITLLQNAILDDNALSANCFTCLALTPELDHHFLISKGLYRFISLAPPGTSMVYGRQGFWDSRASTIMCNWNHKTQWEPLNVVSRQWAHVFLFVLPPPPPAVCSQAGGNHISPWRLDEAGLCRGARWWVDGRLWEALKGQLEERPLPHTDR